MSRSQANIDLASKYSANFLLHCLFFASNSRRRSPFDNLLPNATLKLSSSSTIGFVILDLRAANSKRCLLALRCIPNDVAYHSACISQQYSPTVQSNFEQAQIYHSPIRYILPIGILLKPIRHFLLPLCGVQCSLVSSLRASRSLYSLSGCYLHFVCVRAQENFVPPIFQPAIFLDTRCP